MPSPPPAPTCWAPPPLPVVGATWFELLFCTIMFIQLVHLIKPAQSTWVQNSPSIPPHVHHRAEPGPPPTLNCDIFFCPLPGLINYLFCTIMFIQSVHLTKPAQSMWVQIPPTLPPPPLTVPSHALLSPWWSELLSCTIMFIPSVHLIKPAQLTWVQIPSCHARQPLTPLLQSDYTLFSVPPPSACDSSFPSGSNYYLWPWYVLIRIYD